MANCIRHTFNCIPGYSDFLPTYIFFLCSQQQQLTAFTKTGTHDKENPGTYDGNRSWNPITFRDFNFTVLLNFIWNSHVKAGFVTIEVLWNLCSEKRSHPCRHWEKVCQLNQILCHITCISVPPGIVLSFRKDEGNGQGSTFSLYKWKAAKLSHPEKRSSWIPEERVTS